ncbi:DUF11 domain-containing protein [Streptomyces leeuwenhoekii]|uniref:Protein tolB n=1 Tax=Streptomyces leeuwenhoekii TaxID=1437453 RepID=A0A0F7VUE3_STRLW|nr:DUF11 domain-containing protein [Streptomyces leeuwenhoekii]CQR61132.1 Protein tolB [Streptomyces leeuwenhoekii]
MGTAAPGGRHRLGRLGTSLLLLVPLLGVTAASGRSDAGPGPSATDVAQTRIAYAGTRHRSLGRVDTSTSSKPLFKGPAHYDLQPSALGDTLVFTSRRDERKPQVYLRAADGSVRRLTEGRDAAHPRLTPDGKAVVFDSAEPGGADGGTQRDLWMVGTAGPVGTGLTRLTKSPANEESPTVSPDGKRLAYSGDADPLAGAQIYTRQLDGGTAPTATRITRPAGGTATQPVWNPVGDSEHANLIAYTATTEADGPRLRVTDGSTDRPLLAGEQAQWDTHGAAWLPDGNQVLFLSPNRTCECEGDWDHVFRVPAHSEQTPSLVLSEDREVLSPTWLGPLDGGGAVVERTSAPGPHVVTLQDIRSDGADPRDLGKTILKEDPAADTNTDATKDPLFQPADGYDPWTERQNYTPDGRRIVVTRFEDTPDGRIQRIWTVDADGSHGAALRLAGRGPKDWDTDPTFSPDGRYLAFTRTSPGGVAGPSRIFIADVASGEIRGKITPPDGQPDGGDAQPTWSSDGTTLAFTRNHVINGKGGNKHIWTVRVDDLGARLGLRAQHDLSADVCPGACEVIDDSPAFSPDGRTIAFNRKSGGGLIDERNGLLVTTPEGEDCRVLLPTAARGRADACRQDLPDVSATGPHQPRDAAWTADGNGMVLSFRTGRAVNNPEKLHLLDVASGDLTPLTLDLPGRQKEPAVQQSVDLAVGAPATVPPVTVGSSATVRVDVVNNGPAASPGTRLTVTPPSGVQVSGMTRPGGTCGTTPLQCDVGVVRPGDTVPVDVAVTGLTAGDAPLDWTVTGTVLDPRPGDNAGRTVVPVREVTPPPTSAPPTPAPPTPTSAPPVTRPPTPAPPAPAPPSSAPPPAEPDQPEAGPGVRITARPNPGYVGGRVVVTYTVSNGRNALATGLRLRVGLPAGIPADTLPPGCDSSRVCALPDLEPGQSIVVPVVLRPRKAMTGQATADLTTSGTDADRRDNTARQRLRILQPRIVAVPDIGKPGFVTSVRGEDFPPGVPVRFAWKPGITAAAAPTRPKADGTFIGQLLILAKDQTGPRTITARGPGFSPVKTDFLVVSGTVQPPDEVTRR